jgi:lysozyme
MTPENLNNLVLMLKRHEGFRDQLYKCTAGHLTIGYGHNCDAHGDVEKYSGRLIATDEATNLLFRDIGEALKDCTKFVRSFVDFSDIQQAILIDMCFNLGINGLMAFKKMLKGFITGDHKAIAFEMLNSTWASQVGKRTADLIYMTFTDEFI